MAYVVMASMAKMVAEIEATGSDGLCSYALDG